MIPKSVQRFSEKIMLKQNLERHDDSTKSHPALGASRKRAFPLRSAIGLQRAVADPAGDCAPYLALS